MSDKIEDKIRVSSASMLCSDFFNKVSSDLWPWVALAEHCDSCAGFGGRGDPLGFALQAEAEPNAAPADYAAHVRHGTLQPDAVPVRGASVLSLCRSAGYFTCDGLVCLRNSPTAIPFGHSDRLLPAIRSHAVHAGLSALQ